MSYEWGRDQRFKYDSEGRQIGYTDGYADLLRQRDAEAARVEAGRGGSAGTVICVGLMVLGWAIQQLRARFPVWQLFLLVLGIAFVSSWAVRRQLRRSGDWSSRAVNVFGGLVFVAVALVLGAMVYDLDHLGVLALGVLIALFILFLVLGLALHVLSAIARHPIRTAFVSIMGGWLIWVIFFQKPEHTVTRAVTSQPATVRKSGPGKRSPKSVMHQPTAKSTSTVQPAPPTGDDAIPAHPAKALNPADDADQPNVKRPESDPSAKQFDNQ